MSRIIIITGKGGVGKSSVAAAHAVKSAQEGVKTLLVSTDMAHNIADIFQIPVGGHVVPLMEHLYGLELDPDLMIKEEFPDMNRSIQAMFQEAGLSAQKMGMDVTFPGFDDLFCLLKIGKMQESGEYERIIVDCAPTGETLSLLKLPELLAWYMEKFFPVGKTMVRLLSPISRVRYHVNLPSSEGMDDIGRMHRQLMHLQELLKDDQICSVRLVATPEKMVVEETKRSFMYLNLYGYPVDGIFINRVLSDGLCNEFFEHWREIQKNYIAEIETVFAGLSIYKIPWLAEEIRGEKALAYMVDEMFDSIDENDFYAIHSHVDKETYEKVEGGYLFRLQIPDLTQYQVEEDLLVACHGMDLDITLHNFKRRIPLPDLLYGASVEEVSVCGDGIEVYLKTGDKS